MKINIVCDMITKKEKKMTKNRTLMQYFEWYINPEENLWKKVKESAEHLKKIGITDIWLPPAYKDRKSVV